MPSPHPLIHFLYPRISDAAADVGLEAYLSVRTVGKLEVWIREALALNLRHVTAQRGNGECLAFTPKWLVQSHQIASLKFNMVFIL